MISQKQLAAFSGLLEELRETNPFYRRKLAGFSGKIADLAALQSIPFTRKSELVEDQACHPPYGTNLTFPLENYVRFHQTSGTSGKPLRWLDTPESWDWMVENWKQIFEKCGAKRTDRFFFAFSFGPFLGFWLAFEAAEKLGGLCIPGGGLSSVGRLQLLLDQEATVLCCTPTYALHLAEVARKENIDLARGKVQRIVVAGEPGGSIPEVRAAIESSWPGALVYDHHGMTEVGPVSYPCPESRDRLHILGGAYLAEIVDPGSGIAVSSGIPGELILTPLGRRGSPLIRYKTGDLVRAVSDSIAKPCGCPEEDLGLEGGILGRCDDMVVVRGVNIYPAALEKIIRGIAGIAEYRVLLQHPNAMAELTVEVEPLPECETATLRSDLEKKFEVAFSMRIPVVLVAPGNLPRFELKARRWVVIS